MSIVASGGTEIDINGYKIHKYMTPGTFSFFVNARDEPFNISVDVLVVAGGGGGGDTSGNFQPSGGGGAGEVIFRSSIQVTGTVSVVVGSGGAPNTKGGDSQFGTLIADGGGYGGNSTNTVGGSGGSGGGGRRGFAGGASTKTIGLGNAGGSSAGVNGVTSDAGGGGGATGAGTAGGDRDGTAGTPGGAGYTTSISGASLTYAVGGFGGLRSITRVGVDGTPDTGNGGGGGSSSSSATAALGGSGGSGIVIIRYLLGPWPFIPAPTTTITINNVATTLGIVTKSMNGFRGFGGSVPSGATATISMSQCQKIQHGVGFYNSWIVPTTVVNQGTWADTSITNNSSFTYAVWVASISLENWRNILNINTTTSDGGRRPSLWIYDNDTGFHVRHSTSAVYNEGLSQTNGRMAMNGSAYHVVVTQNGTNMSVYVNGVISDSVTLGSAPVNAVPTDIVASPGAGVAGTRLFGLNKLWFFPYPMTAAQVLAYYSSLSAIIGVPTLPLYKMTFPFTFTNMGAIGFAGPNSITYAANTFGTGNAFLTLGSGNTVGMQRWTVPFTHTYTITIAGAGRNYTRILSSADQYNVNYSAFGAVGTATLSLTRGHILRILVGQQGLQGAVGQPGYLYARSGGCGGTFIYNETTNILLLAAGGGGGNAGDVGGLDSTGTGTVTDPYTNGAGKGDNGKTTTDGSVGRSSLAGTAGTGGGGGGANTQGFGGQGGAGYSGNGLINTANGNTSAAANSFLNGGYGGFGGTSQGGFGGGGNGGTSGGAGAGGGGGYSGGGGGANLAHGAGGGGGGSYTISTWTTISTTTHLGMGYVTIQA